MPVLAGALTCLLSNVLYILSYQTRSLWLLVLSRFVLGFGTSLTSCCAKLSSALPSSKGQASSPALASPCLLGIQGCQPYISPELTRMCLNQPVAEPKNVSMRSSFYIAQPVPFGMW